MTRFVWCALASTVAIGCREPARAAACPPGASATCLAARVLPTGYEGARTALADMVLPSPVVLADSPAVAAEWARRRLRSPVPAVAFPREIAIVYAFGRGSCIGFRSGLDSARRVGADGVRLYLWEDSDGACADTTSYSVLAVAVERPAGASARPTVIVHQDDRQVERALERIRGKRRTRARQRESHLTMR